MAQVLHLDVTDNHLGVNEGGCCNVGNNIRMLNRKNLRCLLILLYQRVNGYMTDVHFSSTKPFYKKEEGDEVPVSHLIPLCSPHGWLIAHIPVRGFPGPKHGRFHTPPLRQVCFNACYLHVYSYLISTVRSNGAPVTDSRHAYIL